jgi:hypothetical protein
VQQNLEVGSILKVRHQGNEVSAKIRKIGRSEGTWRMATLDLMIPGGEVAYCALREEELARCP